MLFPMWVLPVQTLLAMSGPVKSFQELLAEGCLVQWVPGMFCIFCSHQWLGTRQADPEGKQFKVLQEALKKIISRKVKVQTGLLQLLAHGKVSQLTADEISKISSGYVWFDWTSIPQITMRTGDGDDTGSDMLKAVNSIPAYVEAADIFLVLCPVERHSESGQLCGYSSWAKRGWCRVEMAAAVFAKRKVRPMVIVRSSVDISLMFCTSYLHAMPGKGQFTVETDREVVHSIVDESLRVHLAELWEGAAQSPRRLSKARLMTALRSHFLADLGSAEEKAATRKEAEKDLSSFMAQFQFKDLANSKALGSVCCAAAAGNRGVLRALVAGKADVNERVTKASALPDMFLSSGMTPVQIVCQYHGDHEVLELLLELRANLDLANSSGYRALHFAALAGHPQCLDVLLRAGMAIDAVGSHGDTPLMAACWFGQPDTARLLLERRAKVDCKAGIGFSTIINSVWNGSEECLKLLLQYRADVNDRTKPQSATGRAIWGAMWAGRLLLGENSFPGKLSQFAGVSVLGAAAYLGNAEQVQILLAARADATARNGRGLDALELAELEGHSTVVALLREAQGDLASSSLLSI